MASRKNGGATPVAGSVDAAMTGLVDALTTSLTGDSASVEQLQTQIAELNGQVSAKVAAIRGYQERLAGLGVEVPSIPASVASLISAEAPAAPRRGRGRPRGSKNAPRAGAGRKRPANDSNLVEALQGVLKNKSLSVMDAVAAVQKAGYKTSSPNFRVIVNQALTKKGNGFKRVERGVYTAR